MSLTEATPIPAPARDTFGYLALEYTVTLQSAVAACNADKAIIRQEYGATE